MLTIHLALYFIAFVAFIVAACPNGSRFRFEWFAFAALTATLIV